MSGKDTQHKRKLRLGHNRNEHGRSEELKKKKSVSLERRQEQREMGLKGQAEIKSGNTLYGGNVNSNLTATGSQRGLFSSKLRGAGFILEKIALMRRWE